MIYHDNERRRWKRHPVSLLVRLIFPRRGIKDVQDIPMRLIDISEGGASIASEGLTLIPDYFYVKFIEPDLGMISSYVVERTGTAIRCKFCHELSSRQLELIVSQKQTSAKHGLSFSAPMPTEPAKSLDGGFGTYRRHD